MGRKKVTHSDIIGEQGIALIHKIVADMGLLWHPTGLEAGIDGYIELRDPESGEVSNLIIQVQSKATGRDFQAETDRGFDYLCDQRDLDYWLGGNAPVILIRSRPSTDEAYWVSIKDYFKDLPHHESRKIHFDKTKNRFNSTCREELIALARPQDSGIYLAPLPKSERLYSNLLAVKNFSKTIYIAETKYRKAKQLWRELRALADDVGPEWILRNRRIMSFHNLEEYPWREICDIGTLEPFDSDEWAYSDDIDFKREFVQLLNNCLKAKLSPEVWLERKRGYYYFVATEDLSPLELNYKSLMHKAERTVFQAYSKKKDPSQIAYYRHSAFWGNFVRFDNCWYLEITPTYHFTWNGYRVDRYREERLKGIKQLERNPAILGQVAMWADYLKVEPDLFTPIYPFLNFGELYSFEINAGLDDRIWLARVDENQKVEITQQALEELPLFKSE